METREYSKTRHVLRMWKFNNLDMANPKNLCFDSRIQTDGWLVQSEKRLAAQSEKRLAQLEKCVTRLGNQLAQLEKPVSPIGRPANMLF